MAYTYYRSVTLLEAQAGASDSTNFPVTFTGTYSYLATVANGGKVQNSNGYDIAFFSDAALTTALDFELVTYTATTGFLEAHVRVPTLSASTDTVIYLAYGDSGISTFQGNVTGTWNSAYLAVYHLKDGTTLSVADSTGARNGTNSGATAGTGQVDGGAFTVAGSSQYIYAADALASATTATLSGWAYKSTGSNQVLFGRSRNGTGGSANQFTIGWTADGNCYLNVEDASANYPYFAVTPTSGWHYFVVTFDGSLSAASRVKGYFDGTNKALTAGGAGNPASLYASAGAIWIGRQSDNGYTTGGYDEVRFSNVVRSADWITAEYNNQSNPSTFYTMGSEVPVGGGGGGGASPYYLSYYSRLVLGVAH